jgi:hypothetical protein
MDPRRFRLATWCRQPTPPESFEEAAKEAGALAAFSGGFFLDSEPDIAPPSRRFDPVGLLIRKGVVISPPVLRRGSLLLDVNGHVAIQTLGMRDVVLHWGAAGALRLFEGTAALRRVSRPTVFHRAHGDRCPALDGPKVTIVGQQLLSVETGSDPVPIPLNGFVLALPAGDLWKRLFEELAATGLVTYQLSALPGLDGIVAAMAGGPILLSGGQLKMALASEDFGPLAPPVAFSSDGPLCQSLLPRLAVGLTPSRELVVVAVDGGNQEYSLGLSLRELAELTRALGCIDSLNLDGSSSKRMLVGTDTVDLPCADKVTSTAACPLRTPVQSGILVLQKLDGDLPAP